MNHKRLRQALPWVMVLCVLHTACDEDTATFDPPADQQDAGSSDTGTATLLDMSSPSEEMGTTAPPIAQARRGNVKFKGGRRFARDLAQSLALDERTMCRELDQYDCIDEMYRITLEGVEVETLRIWEPLEGLITAPLAVDRVAMHACVNRVTLDQGAVGASALFPELSQPSSLEKREVRGLVSRRVVDRLLRRDATSQEVAVLVDFYDEVVAASDPQPAVTWATLTCFMAATMTENLFY